MQPVMQACYQPANYTLLKKKREKKTHPISENRCTAHVCKQGFDILYPSFTSSHQWQLQHPAAPFPGCELTIFTWT